jgi:hypothetical protein
MVNFRDFKPRLCRIFEPLKIIAYFICQSIISLKIFANRTAKKFPKIIMLDNCYDTAIFGKGD